MSKANLWRRAAGRTVAAAAAAAALAIAAVPAPAYAEDPDLTDGEPSLWVTASFNVTLSTVIAPYFCTAVVEDAIATTTVIDSCTIYTGGALAGQSAPSVGAGNVAVTLPGAPIVGASNTYMCYEGHAELVGGEVLYDSGCTEPV